MKRGFTMFEVMLSVMILSIMTIVSVWTSRSIVRGWTLATEMADDLQRTDYALAQISSALRSAYFPVDGKATDADGFMLLDGGDGEDDTDSITWTKLGTAIVGRTSRFAKSPHRITLSVKKEDGDMPGGLVADVISKDLRPDDFDEDDDENWEHHLLSENVQGFNCRVLDKEQPFKDDMANWSDEWDTSNCIPRRVQLTFWMKPLEEGKEPYPIVRVIEIPLWDISQKPLDASSDSDKTDGRGRSDGEKGGRGGSDAGGRGMNGGRGGMNGGRGGMNGGGRGMAPGGAAGGGMAPGGMAPGGMAPGGMAPGGMM